MVLIIVIAIIITVLFAVAKVVTSLVVKGLSGEPQHSVGNDLLADNLAKLATRVVSGIV